MGFFDEDLSGKLKAKATERYRLFLQLIGLAVFIYFGSTSTIYVILLSLPFALLLGPVYCGWMCPRGLFQDIFARAGRRALGERFNGLVPATLHPKLMYFRYILLFAVAISLFLSWTGHISEVEMELIGQGLIDIMIFSIFLSFFVDRGACKYFCKEGATAALINPVKMRRIERDTKSCNDCGLCDRVCPMDIRVSKNDSVKDISCLSCFKCVQICPKDSLRIK